MREVIWSTVLPVHQLGSSGQSGCYDGLHTCRRAVLQGDCCETDQPWRSILPGSTPMPHSASKSFNACSLGAYAVSCRAACATSGKVVRQKLLFLPSK